MNSLVDENAIPS